MLKKKILKLSVFVAAWIFRFTCSHPQKKNKVSLGLRQDFYRGHTIADQFIIDTRILQSTSWSSKKKKMGWFVGKMFLLGKNFFFFFIWRSTCMLKILKKKNYFLQTMQNTKIVYTMCCFFLFLGVNFDRIGWGSSIFFFFFFQSSLHERL